MGAAGLEAAVLAANEAFYRAFAARDLVAMDRLWAQEIEVACIHPGWSPLFGRDAVMESWAGILGNPASPNIHCFQARATIYGETAMVVCYEGVGQDYLVATNFFVQEGGNWKLCHHQSGPANVSPVDSTSRSTLVSKRLH